MPVTDQHKDYQKNIRNWELVRDCVAGSSAIKDRVEYGENTRNTEMLNHRGTRYLPPPNADDTSAENVERYRSYLKRANFTNFTGNTQEGFLGMVFRQELSVDLPSQVEYLEENATGGGLSLDQLARGTVSDTLITGRYGLLTDYPQVPEGLTVAQVRDMGLRANILPYSAESIVNWRTEVFAGVKMLVLVVLKEETTVLLEDGFSSECVTQYRVLRLRSGIYTQQMYDDKSVPLTDEVEPRKFDGSRWTEIPFVFVGSTNNDEKPDKACLYDIAEVNVAHYRNSADFEESSFMVGQPTPWASGLTQDWANNVMKGGVQIGSRTVVLLPEGGAFGMAEVSPNQLPQQGMKDKEEQLVKIGANIIRDNGSNNRVDEVKMKFAGQTSKLGTLVGNVQSALVKSIGWCVEFMGGVVDDVELTLNRQFFDVKLDPQEVMANIALLDRGIVAENDVRTRLRQSGWIEHDRSDDDIMEETERDNPLA